MSHSHSHGAPVRIAAISLITTACLLALKLTLGLISGSIAVLSDAVDSGTDLTAATAALLSVRIAAQPADEAHPYGHGKVESMSASVAATIVGLGGGLVVVQAVRRLLGDSQDIDVGVGLIAMVISAAANLALGFFMRREARRSGSMALSAEATHLQTNVVQAGAIITGLALVGLTDKEIFDPLAALALAAYMGWTAIGLVRTATEEIMDAALPPADLEVIHAVLVSHKDQIRGFHRLRTRRAGATRHVDMHLLLDPHLTVAEMHPISESIEREIAERLPGTEVVIHMEPDDGGGGDSLKRLTSERPSD
jgi:cation diffusion facilitator family transporter